MKKLILYTNDVTGKNIWIYGDKIFISCSDTQEMMSFSHNMVRNSMSGYGDKTYAGEDIQEAVKMLTQMHGRKID